MFFRNRQQGFGTILKGISIASVILASSTFSFNAQEELGGVTNGLALWLRADAGVNVVDGNVSEWADQSGNDRHAGQSDANLQPALIENQLTGMPVLRFSDDALGYDGTFFALQSYTVIMLEARNRGGNANFVMGGTDAATNSNLILGYENPTTLRQAHFANDLDATIPEFTTKEFAYSTFIFDFSQGRAIYRNGTQLASDFNLTPLTSNNGATIGSSPAFSEVFYEGDIAEIIVYTRALSDAERESVEAYLDRKYNLSPLPPTQEREMNGVINLGCSELPEATSGDGGAQTAIEFINSSDESISVFWVDLEGTQRPWFDLEGGQSLTQGTFAGHLWLVRSDSGRCLGLYRATDEQGRVEIR